MLKASRKKYELKNMKRFGGDFFTEEDIPSELEEDSDKDRPGRVKACVEE